MANSMRLLADDSILDTSKLTYESASKYSELIFWIISLGIAGVFMIVLVTILWHRHRKRLIKLDSTIEARRETECSPMVCAWESAADRLDSQDASEVLEMEPEEEEQLADDDEEDETPDWDKGDWKPEDDKEDGDLEGEDEGPRYW